MNTAAKIFTAITMLVITIAGASAIPSGGVSYYDMEDGSGTTMSDVWGSNDGTIVDATFNAAVPTFDVSGDGGAYSLSFDGSGDYVYSGGLWTSVSSQNVGSVSAWVKTSTDSQAYLFMPSDFSSGDHSGLILSSDSNCGTGSGLYAAFEWNNGGTTLSGVSRLCGDTRIDDGNWHHIVWLSDGSKLYIYVDGARETLTNFGTAGNVGTWWNDVDVSIDDFNIGGLIRTAGNTLFYTGLLDEVKFFSTNLTESNVTGLFEYSNISGSSPVAQSFSITAKDYYDDSSITSFWAYIDGVGNSSTTNGTIITSLLQNDTGTYDITIGASDYFQRTYASRSVTSNLEAVLIQAAINFSSYELVSNNSISGCNYTIGGVQNTTFYLSADEYTVLAECPGYFAKNHTFNVTALDNLTISITDIYSSLLHINASNAYTSNPLTNFSGWIYHPGSGNNRTYNTTSGNASVNMIPGNFTVYIQSPGYAITQSLNYENITINESSYNLSFSLYSNNSILISIKNENTGLTITDNITITVTGDNETQYSTTSGSYFLENLTDGNYSIKFSGDNYTIRSYSVTVAENSFQTLTAYLTSSTDTVIMTYLDEDSGATLEGVSASISRLIGGVWTVVQSKESDITGRIQFPYIPDVKYKFTASLTGYDEKIFYLDPVLFDSYNVKMSKETTITNAPAYQGVTVTTSPSAYYNNQVNNFSITFGSPDGLLTSYRYNITAPTGQFYSGSGSNAYGGSFDHSVNITGGVWTSTVTVKYCYDTSISTEKCYVRTYELRNPGLDPGVMTDNQDNDYGLGIFERILITLIVTIIVTGILSLIGGIILGAPIGLIIMGYLTFIGFMPLWAALPSMFVGFIIIAARSS